MSDPATVVQGVGLVIPKQIRLIDGVSLSQAYDVGDVLTTTLGKGDQEPALVIVLTYWDPILGPPNFSIELVPTDTAGVTPAVYVLQTQVTRPSTNQTAEVWSGQIEVLPRPGTALAQPTYITLADLMVEMSCISDYQQMFRDDSGFEGQRAKARKILDELIHRNTRGFGYINSMARSTTFQNYLDNNYLWLTQPLIDHQVFSTLGMIFGGQVMANPKTFGELSREYRVRAELALRGTTAEIRGPDSQGQNAGTINGQLLALADFSSSKVLRA